MKTKNGRDVRYPKEIDPRVRSVPGWVITERLPG